MIVLVAWAAVLFVTVLALAALALGLRGHLVRFARAAHHARADLDAPLRALAPARPAGRHHAE